MPTVLLVPASISHQTTTHHIRLQNPPPSIVQNFINYDSKGTINSVGIRKLPEYDIDDAEKGRSK
jgi:hypothetical protein